MRYFFLALGFIFFLSCKGRLYNVPTRSMEGTIEMGDKIYVKHTKNFKRNDIVVFDFYGDDYSSPIDGSYKFNQHWERRVYRLIALSGDTIEIKDDEVFINNQAVPFPEKGKLKYSVYSKTDISELLPEDELEFQPATTYSDTFIYHINITRNFAEELKQKNPEVIKVTRYKDEGPTTPDTFYAKASAAGKWGAANYGPLYIPKPGEMITVNGINYKLYHNIPGIKMGENKIIGKLYFILGDNRHGAQDSRYIGLISESNMYGVVK